MDPTDGSKQAPSDQGNDTTPTTESRSSVDGSKQEPPILWIGDAQRKAPFDKERFLSNIPDLTPEQSAEAERRAAEFQRNQQMAARQKKFEDLFSRRKRYAGSTFENYECRNEGQADAVRALVQHAVDLKTGVNTERNVLIVGPPGTGKDHLLFAVARHAITAGLSPRWVNGEDLWGELREAISDKSGEANIIRRYVNVGILLISDPVHPRGPLSDYQAQTLFRIIDERYANLLPTWVTMNVANRLEAEDRMGAQVVDRLVHGAIVLTCNWPSYRSGALAS